PRRNWAATSALRTSKKNISAVSWRAAPPSMMPRRLSASTPRRSGENEKNRRLASATAHDSRQSEPERAPPPRFTLHADLAAVTTHDLFDDVESKSGSFSLLV